MNKLPSDKMLDLLRSTTKDYLKAIEDGAEEYILNSYLNVLRNITHFYLEYKKEGL